VDEGAEAGAAVLGVEIEQADEIGRAHGDALGLAGVEEGQELLGAGNGLGGAVKFHPVVAGGEAAAEGFFDAGEVFLVAAVELVEVAGVRVVERLGGGHGLRSGKL
jgi:hypothetical protein